VFVGYSVVILGHLVSMTGTDTGTVWLSYHFVVFDRDLGRYHDLLFYGDFLCHFDFFVRWHFDFDLTALDILVVYLTLSVNGVCLLCRIELSIC
jgi:hypothetical protein